MLNEKCEMLNENSLVLAMQAYELDVILFYALPCLN
jgi:hypothetical protein